VLQDDAIDLGKKVSQVAISGDLPQSILRW